MEPNRIYKPDTVNETADRIIDSGILDEIADAADLGQLDGRDLLDDAMTIARLALNVPATEGSS